MSRPPMLTLLLVLALLASACGSTVRQTSAEQLAVAPVTDGTDLNAGMSAPGTMGSTAGGTVPNAPAAGAPIGSTTGGTTGSASGSPAGTSSGGGSGATAGSAGSPAAGGGGAGTPAPAAGAQPPPPPAPGQAPAGAASTEPIKVGVPYLEGATNLLNGLGTEVSFGDGQVQAQAMVDAINAAGGINGRPLEPHFSGIDVSAADQVTEWSSTCTELTEDVGVFAVLQVINPPEHYVACLAEHGAPMVNVSLNPGDEALYERYGAWAFAPSLVNLDRAKALELDTLRAEGAFDAPLVKVGVLMVTKDDPSAARVVDRTIIPRLEAWGVPYEVADAKEVPQVSAAQLRFAATGVNIVLFVAPSGIAQILFMNAAENQGYRPRYFTSDSDSTRLVSETVSPNQARNISGVGTLPIANVPVRSYPTTGREEQCLEVIRAGGEDNRDRLTNITATLTCEMFWLFQAIASAAGPDLTTETFRQAYPTLGTSYQPVSTFGIDFASGGTDNSTLYRPYAWEDGCGCLVYTSDPIAIPR